ncbi:hypothetical protein SPRG_09342 [Saprolegnia parasitica CBS 223.65]|uniref:Uncharacterized protein n=1 Tax=Saprolegnia parasitica (strain CBS 223.65) TaxID=695850 RepID=A0A067C8A0_SAPPC|nr:hypothetical protein SPRG_09342 [Saprolegnia parasitica CBS 223.65]KDO25400.1 hypothetical protein SPRG_09342 [Saprolegnia parasitica CBS 223.65]|eukprot:XP_012203828.1 hypothetical protein SPRG_09342 [Saprolegnia parasitica CBS 223.65]
MPRVTNYVDDIAGAKPCLKPYMYTHKPPTADVSGSHSRQLHPSQWNKGANPQFQQLPIEGSSPSHTGFTTNRVVNPLNPKYPLPYCEPAPIVPPRFLRDSYQVDDIEGTRMRPLHARPPRDTMNVSDVPGATAHWHELRKKERDILDCSDITHAGFKTKRVTDNLRPEYVVNGFPITDDPLSYTKKPYELKNHPFYPLQTKDIKGANPEDSQKGIVGGIPTALRRTFVATNNVTDIFGAQANTVHHSIVSNRRVDPNFPDYVDLDGDKLETGLPIPKMFNFPTLHPGSLSASGTTYRRSNSA